MPLAWLISLHPLSEQSVSCHGAGPCFLRMPAAAAEVIRNAHGWQERMRLFSILWVAVKSMARDRNRRRERSAQDQHAPGQHKQLRGVPCRHERHSKNKNAHQCE